MVQATMPTVTAADKRGILHPDSSFAGLSPDLQAQLYGRLGGAALVYAGAWIANFFYMRARLAGIVEHEDVRFWEVTTLVCTAAGILVYFLCRRKLIPAKSFPNVASAFEVLGGFGIMVGFFGFEAQGAEYITRLSAALGFAPSEISARVVQPLLEANVRPLYHEGVTWVSVWLIVFPLVVPFPFRRTIVTTFLTAASVPAVLGLSLLAHDTPPIVEAWIQPYFLDLVGPTFICAGIAAFGARVVYGLTRELSKARQMGSYRLVEKIGAGGMGEVWKAKHRMLVRPAAIKLIRRQSFAPGSTGADTAVKRFEREAQATSSLSSPHTIELYDFGVSDDGTFFYVMELLNGVDLRTLVERHGPLPAERAIHILRAVCHSLADAHALGVVHRDIKPGNVFVCRRGQEFDFVKVLDFGLVKQVGEASPQLTMEGAASGTPAFMAPEMALDNRSVDARADIYAVGCLAYWLLTGQLVFEGDSTVAILVQHAKDPPRPPSTRTELPIPADLETLVLACLEKSPSSRPESARALSHSLAACLEKLPPWTEERAAKWWQTYLPDHVLDATTAPIASAT